jgi:hypothetical protein
VCAGFTALPLSLRIERYFEQADVAQLVEQSIRNRQVIGSSPIVGSISLSLRSKPPGIFVSLKFAFAPVARRSAHGRPRGVSPMILAIGARQCRAEKRSMGRFGAELTKGMSFPHFAEISSCYFCLVFRIIFCTRKKRLRTSKGHEWKDTIDQTFCGSFALQLGSWQAGKKPVCCPQQIPIPFLTSCKSKSCAISAPSACVLP